jgi:hypothetical protein
MSTKVALSRHSDQDDAARRQRTLPSAAWIANSKQPFKTKLAALVVGGVIKKVYLVVMVTVVDATTGVARIVHTRALVSLDRGLFLFARARADHQLWTIKRFLKNVSLGHHPAQ